MTTKFNILSKLLLITFALGNNAKLMAEAITSKEFFSGLNSQTMHLVDQFYDKDAHFQDPLGEMKGAEKIKAYYTKLYSGAEYVRFSFDNQIKTDLEEVLFWSMTLKSKNLNSGKEYTVTGNSYFKYSKENGKCIYHRDYFDMGDFVYERVPVLKQIIGFVKGKMKDHP